MPPATRHRPTHSQPTLSDAAFTAFDATTVDAMFAAAERSSVEAPLNVRRSTRRPTPRPDSNHPPPPLITHPTDSKQVIRKMRPTTATADKENGPAARKATDGFKPSRPLAVSVALPLGVRRSSRLSTIGRIDMSLVTRSVARPPRARQQQPIPSPTQTSLAPPKPLPPSTLTAQEEVKRLSSGISPAQSEQLAAEVAAMEDAKVICSPPIISVDPVVLSVACLPIPCPPVPSTVEAERKLRQHQQLLLPINTACTSLLSPTKPPTSSAVHRSTIASSLTSPLRRRASVSAKARPRSLLPPSTFLTFHGRTPTSLEVRRLSRAEEAKQQRRRSTPHPPAVEEPVQGAPLAHVGVEVVAVEGGARGMEREGVEVAVAAMVLRSSDGGGEAGDGAVRQAREVQMVEECKSNEDGDVSVEAQQREVEEVAVGQEVGEMEEMEEVEEVRSGSGVRRVLVSASLCAVVLALAGLYPLFASL